MSEFVSTRSYTLISLINQLKIWFCMEKREVNFMAVAACIQQVYLCAFSKNHRSNLNPECREWEIFLNYSYSSSLPRVEYFHYHLSRVKHLPPRSGLATVWVCLLYVTVSLGGMSVVCTLKTLSCAFLRLLQKKVISLHIDYPWMLATLVICE